MADAKIAQVCPRYHPFIGGVETHVKAISERLVGKGFEIDVLTTDPSGRLWKEEMINGVKVKRFKSWAPNEAYYFSGKLKKWLMVKSDDYDIVHAHSYHALPALYAAEAKAKNKLIFSSHYHGKGHAFLRILLHIPYKFLGGKIFERADKVVCSSNYEKNLVTKNFKVKEEEIVIIPNGVKLEDFKGLIKNRKEHRTILCVGRLEKYKGIQFLIRILPKLDNDVFLDIVGKGPYKERLIRLTRKLGIDNRTRFFQDLSKKELLQRYVDADLFALLSKHEAYGISVAEALSSGTPCIVADTSALSEWIDDKNCFGIRYPIDLDELASLVNNVIGRSIGVLRLPDWDEVTDKLVNVYKNC
jgi:glycosyltransferase involved in cell wall biosynthesis